MIKYFCEKDKLHYRIKKTGIHVVLCDTDGEPEELWYADLWECPTCKHNLLAGFAKVPYRTKKTDPEAFARELEALYAKPKSYRKVKIG